MTTERVAFIGPPLLQRNCCKHCSISGVIQTDYQSTFGNLPRNHLEFLQRNLFRGREARQRFRGRDESEWPILAAARGAMLEGWQSWSPRCSTVGFCPMLRCGLV